MRWFLVILTLAGCEKSDRAESRPTTPPPEPEVVAAAPAADAAPPPADAAPAPEDALAGPDAHINRGVFAGNKKELDVVTTADFLPDLSRYKGLEGKGGGGYGVGDAKGSGSKGSGSSGGGSSGADVGAKVAFESSSGDFSGLSKEEVDRVVKSRKGTIRACYQRELQKEKDLAGKVVIQFTIDAEGKVTKASVASSTLNNASVEDCVKRQISKLKFPAKGGAIVKYPFIFSNG